MGRRVVTYALVVVLVASIARHAYSVVTGAPVSTAAILGTLLGVVGAEQLRRLQRRPELRPSD